MYHILKLQTQYQFIVALSIMIINKIQQSYICISVPNKPFSSLLEVSAKNHMLLKTFNSEFQGIEVWFTDQNSQRNRRNKKKYT